MLKGLQIVLVRGVNLPFFVENTAVEYDFFRMIETVHVTDDMTIINLLQNMSM